MWSPQLGLQTLKAYGGMEGHKVLNGRRSASSSVWDQPAEERCSDQDPVASRDGEVTGVKSHYKSLPGTLSSIKVTAHRLALGGGRGTDSTRTSSLTLPQHVYR
jgi:hypothetical protein